MLTLPHPARGWLHRATLDRRLAGGADPATSQELAGRASKLVSRRHRRVLAAGLRRVLRTACEPTRGLSVAVPPQRREVLDAQSVLGEIAELLEGEDEVSARGVALIDRLLTDGTSPIYAPFPRGTLAADLRHARAALLLR